MLINKLEVYGIIYKITNIINGKVYIGQTIEGFNKRYGGRGQGIERVYNTYLSCKKRNTPYNKYLLRSLEKYGFEAFKVDEIFDFAFSKTELDIKEDIWINYFDCINNGYNCRGGGAKGKLSKETKNKMSISKTGKHHTEETKRKISRNQKDEINKQSKKVICLNDFKVFDSLRKCSMYYDCSYTRISKVCRHEAKDTKGLSFMFFEEFLKEESENKDLCIKISSEEINYNNNTKKNLSKEIICINNGLIFKSIGDCERQSLEIFNVKLNKECVRRVCQGERNHHKGYIFKFTSDLTDEDIHNIQENHKLF